MTAKESFLEERQRAEDILLGSLGYGEDASIVEVAANPKGYAGTGRFKDGETFDFSCEEDLDDLQLWALDILQVKKKVG